MKTSASKRTRSSRLKAEPCEEASSATLRSPASSISRKSRCRSIASGVVCGAGRVTPPTTHSIVPTRPAWRPAASSTDRRRNAVVDFPFVPVTPDHLERLRRLPEKRVRSDGHRGAGVVHQQLGDTCPARAAARRRGRRHRPRPPLREVVPVGPRPGHAEERGPRPHPVGVVREVGDLDVPAGAGLARREHARQVVERHGAILRRGIGRPARAY